MPLNVLLNLLFICLINAIFMVAGILLNSVVIISLWKSTQLLKSRCYFMILVLSCFDLTTVIVMHPLIMTSAVITFGKYNKLLLQFVSFLSMIFLGFSMYALLTLNIERFLGVTFPIFHRTSVTKKTLLCILTLSLAFSGVLATLSFRELVIPDNILVTICMPALLFSFVLLNLQMLLVARAAKRRKEVASYGSNELKRSILDFRKTSTSSLTVLCLVVCSSPEIILSSICLERKISLYDKKFVIFAHWVVTFVAMNSTFNSLIFFWRNAILRREGMKILRCFQSRIGIQD